MRLSTTNAGADDLAGMFHRHARELLRYCTRRIGAQLAEDVVAETFLVAHERRDRFDAVDPGVYLRQLNSFAIVEEVGERP